MPAKSAAQKRLMDAAAHSPAFAKKAGIPSKVAKEYSKESKGMKFGSGGRTDLQKLNKPKTSHGKSAFFKEGGEMKESKAMAKKEIAFMQKKGAPKSMVKHEKEEYGMKKGGMAKKMRAGGLAAGHKTADGIAKKGKTKGMEVTMRKGGKC